MFKGIIAGAAALLLSGGLLFAQAQANGGGTPAQAGSVKATWEWAKAPKSKIGPDMMNFKKQVVLEPVAGSKGAQFALEKGECKFKTENGQTALYHNCADSARVENLAKKRKAEYSVTINDAATITLTVQGNGGKSPARCVAIYDAAGTLLASVNNLSQDEAPTQISVTNAPKGTYTILGNGHRIIKVEASN